MYIASPWVDDRFDAGLFSFVPCLLVKNEWNDGRIGSKYKRYGVTHRVRWGGSTPIEASQLPAFQRDLPAKTWVEQGKTVSEQAGWRVF